MPFKPTYNVPEDRQAYTLGAGRVGCLMLHGFIGSPASSRPMAEYLAELGVTVHCPLLPGHGEFPNKLYGVKKQDWIAEAEEGLAYLQGQCDEIILMGHSMGCVLGAYLAIQHDHILGQIMLAPAYDIPDKRIRLLGVAKYVMPWFYPLKMKRLHRLVHERLHDFDPTMDLDDPAIQAKLPEMSRVPSAAIDEMRKTVEMGRRLWPKLDIPVIIFQGGDDVAVDPENSQRLFEVLPNRDKQINFFEEAGHELMRPFDPAHKEVWPKVTEFIQEHSSQAE